MRLLPRLMKMLAIASVVVFCISMMRASMVPVWGGSVLSLGNTSAMSAMTSPTAADLGNIEVDQSGSSITMDTVNRNQINPQNKASGIAIVINSSCDGISPAGQVYHGVWKKLGRKKAKCLENGGGQPGSEIIRNKCRIVTRDGRRFDNLNIVSDTTCKA